MPGLYAEYEKSVHAQRGIGCLGCHDAEEGELDAFEHDIGGGKKAWISLIVSPKDCGQGGCHEREVEEFAASVHADARQLVTRGVGRYFRENLVGSRQLPEPAGHAAGTTGCLQCHGSVIEMLPSGRPTPQSWPNSGIARQNPDGSVGNCAACHERHAFSVAQARRPESCTNCHNAGGGEPSDETYTRSRHGAAYFAKTAQMNLDSRTWVAGVDYSAAPTCATCHMSAAPATTDSATALPVTHNINERLGWSELLQSTNTLAIDEKCGLPIESPYSQPKPDESHWDAMKQTCRSCHASSFVDNYRAQYEQEVTLFRDKWLRPGKELYRRATAVLQAADKDRYRVFTQTLDYAWWGICNGDAKNAHFGSGMMSAGQVELGNGGAVSGWYTAFIPSVEAIIEKYEGCVEDQTCPEVEPALDALRDYFDEEIRDNPMYYGPWP